jgi:hypothetical protein
MLIDDFSQSGLVSNLGTKWRGVSDQIMGGVSEASIGRECIGGRLCLRLTGYISLENSGGFIQASLDLAPEIGALDASRYAGIRLIARGNDERYAVHLRTHHCVRPWQSYRAEFTAGPEWKSFDLPFSKFIPHRIDADLAISKLEFYAED